MFANTFKEAAERIAKDDHLILIASRLEATQILSSECGLEKVSFCDEIYFFYTVK